MDNKFKGLPKDELKEKFEEYRIKIIKKCNSCISPCVNKDDSDYCEGWTRDRCIWSCQGAAKDLIEDANDISDLLTITEEEVDMVVDELSKSAPDDVKVLRNVLENSEASSENEGLVPKMAEVSLNPITGKIDKATECNDDENTPYKLSELILGEIRPSYTESTVKTLSQTYSITFEDAYKVLKMIRNINNQSDDLYSKLPLPMKQVVEGTIGKPLNEITMAEADAATKDLLLQFQTDAEFNEQFVDLEKSIKTSYDDAAKEIGKIEFTSTKEIFMEKLPEEAKKLASENKIEEALKILNVSRAYFGSYHFYEQIKYLSNISQKNKRKINDTSKFMSVVNTFNEKYKYNTRNIKNIKMLVPILYRRLHPTYTWVTEDILKKFVILTCMACKNMVPENINDHTYMFYTVQNLAILDFIDIKQAEEWEFASEIINNLLNVLYMLKDITRNTKFGIDDFDVYTGLYIMKNFTTTDKTHYMERIIPEHDIEFDIDDIAARIPISR